jgi:hypothetical protein
MKPYGATYGEIALCAQMTVSLKPHAPKVSPARFDIPPYSLNNGIQGSSNFVQGQGPVHNTTPVSCARRFGLKQAETPLLRSPLSMFLSKCLTCYTDVESNGRDASY